MKIFDSLKNNKWSGRGLEIKSNSILALKSANFSHQINIRAGKYVIKVVGKKRTGNGKIIVEILSNQNESLLKEELSFTSNSLFEHSISFESITNVGLGKIKFSREKAAYGSIEIGRIYVDLINNNPITNKSPKASRRGMRSEVLQDRNSGYNLFKRDFPVSFSDKKVAFIIPYHIYGGAEVYIQNIINNFSNPNISILYMKPNNLRSNITSPSVSHRVIKNSVQLHGIIKSNNYDYIVYYNRADIYNLLTRMKSRAEITSKLIEIYHSDFVWAGALSAIKKRSCIDRLIAVSKSLALDIEGIDKSNRHVIPVGIDLEKFQYRDAMSLREKYNIGPYKFVIGTVARLSKEKQVEYILKLAFEMPNFEFIIAGEGTEKSSLTREIEKLSLPNVKLLGYQKNISRIYNLMDAFVLASKIEGTPISIIEAMASGVPVFSNMVGAIPDLIEDGVTGFRITEDPVKDADIIKSNINDLDTIQRARKYVENNHDIKQVHSRFLKSILSIDSFFVERISKDSFLLDGEYI